MWDIFFSESKTFQVWNCRVPKTHLLQFSALISAMFQSLSLAVFSSLVPSQQMFVSQIDLLCISKLPKSTHYVSKFRLSNVIIDFGFCIMDFAVSSNNSYFVNHNKKYSVSDSVELENCIWKLRCLFPHEFQNLSCVFLKVKYLKVLLTTSCIFSCISKDFINL